MRRLRYPYMLASMLAFSWLVTTVSTDGDPLKKLLLISEPFHGTLFAVPVTIAIFFVAICLLPGVLMCLACVLVTGLFSAIACYVSGLSNVLMSLPMRGYFGTLTTTTVSVVWLWWAFRITGSPGNRRARSVSSSAGVEWESRPRPVTDSATGSRMTTSAKSNSSGGVFGMIFDAIESAVRTVVPESAEHKEARFTAEFHAGEKEAAEEGFFGSLIHGVGDIISTVVPSSPEHKSREAGYHRKK